MTQTDHVSGTQSIIEKIYSTKLPKMSDGEASSIFGAMKFLRVLCYHLRKKRRAIICPKTCEEAVPKIGSLINFLEAHYENG